MSLSYRPRLALLLLTLAGGCARFVERGDGKSPLVRPELAGDAVVLDIVSVRCDWNDPEVNGPLWDSLDEQRLPPEVRRRLAANGLRAGIVGSRLPLKLEELVQLKEQAAAADEPAGGVDLTVEPRARQRQHRVRLGRRINVIVTGEATRHAELAVLVRNEQGEVTGRTYRQAMGLLAVRAAGEADGRVRLEVVPELEHGEPQRRFVPADGMLRVEFGPPHEVFDELRIEAPLSPGEILVLTCLPERAGTLGGHFFSEQADGQARQKLLLVRLTRAAELEPFGPAAGL